MAINDTKIGQIRTMVGSVQGKQLRFLAHVHHCKKDACKIKSICPFEPKGRCTAVYTFLAGLYRDWVDPESGVGDRLSQVQLDRIGVHLMPLYQQLIRFQMETIVLDETVYTDRKGVIHAHPQFGEIRATLEAIRKELKELGLEKIWLEKFNDKPRPIPTGRSLDDIMKHGEEGAYEALEKEVEEETKRRDTEEGEYAEGRGEEGEGEELS